MRCAVKTCNNNNKKRPCIISFFNFPSDPKLSNQWKSFCNREDKINIKTSQICMAHFKPEDFDNNLQFEMGFTKRRHLKSGAVPTLRKESSKDKDDLGHAQRMPNRKNKRIAEMLINRNDTESVSRDGFAKHRLLKRDAIPTVNTHSPGNVELGALWASRIEKRQNKKIVNSLLKSSLAEDAVHRLQEVELHKAEWGNRGRLEISATSSKSIQFDSDGGDESEPSQKNTMSVTQPQPENDLKNLLHSWSLDQHYNHFVEEKITIKHFPLMQSKFIDKLFQNLPLGDQILFENHLQIWKLQMLLNSDVNHSHPTSINDNNSPKIKSEDESNNENSETVELFDDNSQDNDLLMAIEKTDTDVSDIEIMPNRSNVSLKNTTSTTRTLYPTPRSLPKTSGASGVSTVSRYSHASSSDPLIIEPICTLSVAPIKINTTNIQTVTNQNCRYDLQNILDSTSGGRVIVHYYNKHQNLREEHRAALINVIARYIDANGGNLTLGESTQLEDQILQIFPTEKAEFYRTGKRGRLYNKMANMRRCYKKFNTDNEFNTNSGASSPTPSATSNSIVKEEFMDDYDDCSVDDLRAKSMVTGNFGEFWKSTQIIRLKNIDDIETLTEILDIWPEYRDPNKIEFISMDFIAKHPTATKFSEIFVNNIAKLEKLLFTKVSTCSAAFKTLQQYQKATKECRYFLILWVLHQLFPPTHHVAIDEFGVKRKKRYSILDSQNATFCIRSSMTLIDSYLNSKETSTPPMILIIGELGLDIQEIYVYFEDIRYPMTSILQAAELCLQLYFLFNIDFPEEASLYYNFMQTYFLNIEPEIKNSKIYTTINDLNAY